MKIELERDIKKLRKDIDVLQRAIDAVICSAEFRSLFGKTQFLDNDVVKGLRDPDEVRKNGGEWTDRRTRGDHSINVAAIASRFVEMCYIDGFEFEQKTEITKPEIIDAKVLTIPDFDKRYESPISNNYTGEEKFPAVVLREGVDPESLEYQIYALNKRRAMLLALLSGYAHDIGHTPFGHDGEDAITKALDDYQFDADEQDIRRFMAERVEIFGTVYEQGILGHTDAYINKYLRDRENQPKDKVGGICGFEHIEQSYINFLNIINGKGQDGQVIIPTDLLEVIKWAILAHSRSRISTKAFPRHIKTHDQLVVHAIRTADKVDYQITDGYEMDQLMKIIKPRSVYSQEELTIYDKIDYFIKQWVQELKGKDEVSDDLNAIGDLKDYRDTYDLWAIIYCELHVDEINEIAQGDNIEDIVNNKSEAPIGTTGVFKTDKARNKCIVRKLTEYFLTHYDRIPDTLMQEDTEEAGRVKAGSSDGKTEYMTFDKKFLEKIDYSHALITIAFISSLTNSAATQLYNSLVDERILQGEGHGIEAITSEDMHKIRSEDTKAYITYLFEQEIGKSASNISKGQKRQLIDKIIEIMRDNKRAVKTLYEHRVRNAGRITNEQRAKLGINEREVQAGLTPKGLIAKEKIGEARYDGDEADKIATQDRIEADAKRIGRKQTSHLQYPNIAEMGTEEHDSDGER